MQQIGVRDRVRGPRVTLTGTFQPRSGWLPRICAKSPGQPRPHNNSHPTPLAPKHSCNRRVFRHRERRLLLDRLACGCRALGQRRARRHLLGAVMVLLCLSASALASSGGAGLDGRPHKRRHHHHHHSAANGAQANPLNGRGMWIWYVSQSNGGNVSSIVARARRNGVSTLMIKSGDGTGYWSQFSRSLISTLHRSGFKVCGWQFVYGNNPVGEPRQRRPGRPRRLGPGAPGRGRRQGAGRRLLRAEDEVRRRELPARTLASGDRADRALDVACAPAIHACPGQLGDPALGADRCARRSERDAGAGLGLASGPALRDPAQPRRGISLTRGPRAGCGRARTRRGQPASCGASSAGCAPGATRPCGHSGTASARSRRWCGQGRSA
jgi:hypothetical protein